MDKAKSVTEDNEILIPTSKEVTALARKTGESTRKCYFWLLAEKNKKSDGRDPWPRTDCD